MTEQSATPAGPPHNPVLVAALVGCSTLLSAMGFSAVSVALPEIGRALAVSVEDSSWLMLAFLLATTSLMLPGGRLGDLLGLRRVYLAGFSIAGLAALACGLATTLPTLVAARVVHGIGGAMVMATGPALLTTSFPPHRRGLVLGIASTATYAGLTFGPPVGGLLVSQLGWQWAFWFNVPVAAVVLILGTRTLPRPAPSEGRFDWPSLLTLLAGLPLLLATLALLGRTGPRPWMAAAVPLAAASLLLFIRRQAHLAAPPPRPGRGSASAPLLHLALFRSPVFTGAVVAAIANYIGISSLILMVPFLLEEGLGIGQMAVGYTMMIQPASMALVAILSGALSDRMGTRSLAVGGMVLTAVGLAGLAWFAPDCRWWQIAAGLAAVGLGTGIFISPNGNALMGSAPRSRQATASAVLAAARNLGMLLGTTMAATIFSLAGGRTGQRWSAADFRAATVCLAAAAVVALLGAVASAARPDLGPGPVEPRISPGGGTVSGEP